MKGWDFLNLLGAFDESLATLIRRLDEGEYEKAKMRAKDMRSVIAKITSHCTELGNSLDDKS